MVGVVLHALAQSGLTDDELTLILNKAKAQAPAVARQWAQRVVMG